MAHLNLCLRMFFSFECLKDVTLVVNADHRRMYFLLVLPALYFHIATRRS